MVTIQLIKMIIFTKKGQSFVQNFSLFCDGKAIGKVTYPFPIIISTVI